MKSSTQKVVASHAVYRSTRPRTDKSPQAVSAPSCIIRPIWLTSDETVSNLHSHQVENVDFLKLPQELRDLVYGYYFEDTFEGVHDVDLVGAIEGGHFPCSDITLVSKQFRCETFELYRTATSNYRQDHQHCVEINAP